VQHNVVAFRSAQSELREKFLEKQRRISPGHEVEL
jgi:hypothetical protein